MMPYPSYQLYQAERSPSEAERRQADMRLGRAAAGVSEARGRVTRMARAAGRGLGQLSTWPHRPAPRTPAGRAPGRAPGRAAGRAPGAACEPGSPAS
jgi:hypothetical protein